MIKYGNEERRLFPSYPGTLSPTLNFSFIKFLSSNWTWVSFCCFCFRSFSSAHLQICSFSCCHCVFFVCFFVLYCNNSWWFVYILSHLYISLQCISGFFVRKVNNTYRDTKHPRKQQPKERKYIQYIFNNNKKVVVVLCTLPSRWWHCTWWRAHPDPLCYEPVGPPAFPAPPAAPGSPLGATWWRTWPLLLRGRVT